MRKLIIGLLALGATVSSTSTEMDLDTTLIYSATIAYQYGYAAGVGGYSK